MALWVRGRERDADRHWLLMDRVNMQGMHGYPAWFHQSGIKHHVPPDISLPQRSTEPCSSVARPCVRVLPHFLFDQSFLFDMPPAVVFSSKYKIEFQVSGNANAKCQAGLPFSCVCAPPPAVLHRYSRSRLWRLCHRHQPTLLAHSWARAG